MYKGYKQSDLGKLYTTDLIFMRNFVDLDEGDMKVLILLDII